MAVIRMSLDDSHFVSKKPTENVTAPSSQPSTLLRTPPTIRRQVPPGNKKRLSKKGMLIVLIIAFVMIALFGGRMFLKNTGLTPAGVGSLVPVFKPELKKDEQGKTNILLVGIDTRESGTVELNTDTLILASYDSATNRIAMLSYPRDLAVSYPGRTDLVRINSIYAIAENKKKGTGLEKLQEVVETVSGQKIHYYAMVDLKGFIDAIDVVGGIDIFLENDLSGLYPTDGFLYKRVSFSRGWNTMNGKTALEYSRIRKDVKPASEGSDFGRARRQQKVIQAVIDKVSKSETLLDAGKVLELVSVASKNLKVSKFGTEEIQAGITIIKDKGKPSSYSYVLDLYAGGDLARLIDVINYNPYLLGPKTGANNWTEIQKFTRLYFNEPQLATMTKDVLIYTDGMESSTGKANSFKKQYYYADTVVSSQSVLGVNSRGSVYAVGGKQYEQVARFVARELGLEFNPTLPEEIQVLDEKEFAVVAVF